MREAESYSFVCPQSHPPHSRESLNRAPNPPPALRNGGQVAHFIESLSGLNGKKISSVSRSRDENALWIDWASVGSGDSNARIVKQRILFSRPIRPQFRPACARGGIRKNSASPIISAMASVAFQYESTAAAT
jgi:hypothetical protein